MRLKYYNTYDHANKAFCCLHYMRCLSLYSFFFICGAFVIIRGTCVIIGGVFFIICGTS